ncbi:helix-turn-helix transcriptional regulator [Brevundimonas sp.]|uniref:helix-turn-helix transcriptional regulator n=1 Tax=Brevundimonas sp. TaxID=1871086 RepID=UPI0039E274CF
MTKRSDSARDISRALEQVRETGALSDALAQVRAMQPPSMAEAQTASRAMKEAAAASLPALESVRATDPTALTEAARTAQAVQPPVLKALKTALPHLEPLRAAQINAQAVLDALPSDPPVASPAQRSVAAVGDLGSMVRARRTALGLTQQDLADAAGTGRRFVSELEAGKATVELGKALQVCRSLGLDLSVAAR